MFPSSGSSLPSGCISRKHSWVLLTGEYPPQPGGVSDYCQLVARALVTAGDAVQIWAPPVSEPDAAAVGITVHRLPDHFGSRSLTELTRAFERLPADTRVLVQYVPQAFGQRGMNVRFCLWLWRQGSRRKVMVMFHEVATPWGEGWLDLRSWRRHFLAAMTRLMAALVGRPARCVFTSIPGWTPYLRSLLGKRRNLQWLPVPSTMPTEVDAGRVADLRRQQLGGRERAFLIGHFGTFGGHIAHGLRVCVPEILREHPAVTFLFVGRGGAQLADELKKQHPVLDSSRLIATGPLEPEAVAEHLAACDLLVQPYIDGMSSRRTSGMAGLALGRPLLTMAGRLSEPVWAESGAVHLVNSFEELAGAVGPLLANEAERQRLSAVALALYRQHFHIDRTIAQLRADPPEKS